MRNLAGLLIFFSLFAWAVWARGDIPSQYKVLVEKNLFSPSRKYQPPKELPRAKIKTEEIKRGIIFRGIFRAGEQAFAILEISSHLRKKWNLSERKKIFRKGEKIGPCSIEKIESGRVILGGECGELELLLADSPERKRPAPPKKAPKDLKETAKTISNDKKMPSKLILKRLKKIEKE